MSLRYTETMTDGADPRAKQRVGSVLNEKWTLERLLGAGGMGAVYAGRHRNGARAAVKVLHPDLARLPDVRERFLREGYAANRVEHRGAVQVLDDDVVTDGPDDGSAYLVMELLEGESLQERALRPPKLGERDLLEIMDAVLDVLAAAHEHGVVHRDLKPENIFLAHDPERAGLRVKVLDFGLARISEARTVTNAGVAVGTPSFMSPEQARGVREGIDGRTDIFSLGATIFRIITGRRIHDAENVVELVVRMASIPAPRLRSVLPDVSEAFARVIDRALAFERNDRYADARAMRADVRAALDIGIRASASSLHLIPFSARNIRVGAEADLAHHEGDPPRPKTAMDPDTPPESKEAGWLGVDHEVDVRGNTAPLDRARAIARSATLPWAVVLLLLAIGAWKLGPSLQGELVRRASVEPTGSHEAFRSAASESSSQGAPGAPSSEQAPLAAASAEDDAGITIDVDRDPTLLLEDLLANAGKSASGPLDADAGEEAHDAGLSPGTAIQRVWPAAGKQPTTKKPSAAPRKRHR